eukprot:3083621-Prymnesium_polylepis.1
MTTRQLARPAALFAAGRLACCRGACGRVRTGGKQAGRGLEAGTGARTGGTQTGSRRITICDFGVVSEGSVWVLLLIQRVCVPGGWWCEQQSRISTP